MSHRSPRCTGLEQSAFHRGRSAFGRPAVVLEPAGAYVRLERDVVDTVQIKIDGSDDIGELVALHDWLRGEAELRALVKLKRGAAGSEELGPVLDVVTVAVGSGGVAAVLAQSLPTWIRSRRPAVKLTITMQSGRTLELEAADAADAEQLITDLLRQVDDGDA